MGDLLSGRIAVSLLSMPWVLGGWSVKKSSSRNICLLFLIGRCVTRTGCPGIWLFHRNSRWRFLTGKPIILIMEAWALRWLLLPTRTWSNRILTSIMREWTWAFSITGWRLLSITILSWQIILLLQLNCQYRMVLKRSTVTWARYGTRDMMLVYPWRYWTRKNGSGMRTGISRIISRS